MYVRRMGFSVCMYFFLQRSVFIAAAEHIRIHSDLKGDIGRFEVAFIGQKISEPAFEKPLIAQLQTGRYDKKQGTYVHIREEEGSFGFGFHVS